MKTERLGWGERQRDRARQREKRCSNYDRQTEAGKNLENDRQTEAGRNLENDRQTEAGKNLEKEQYHEEDK